MIKEMIKQRYGNDCAIASIANATSLPYDFCLDVAKSIGFEPGSDIGLYPADLMEALSIEFGFYVKRIKEVPALVSVPSVNNPGKHHMVYIDYHRNVHDPSNQKTVNYDYCEKNVTYSYVIKRIDSNW